MKKILLACLPVLLLTTGINVSSANAEVRTEKSPVILAQLNTNVSVSPYILAWLAYQGVLEAQGIPAATELAMAVQTRKITANEIVKAGISANRVSPSALNDVGYMNSLTDSLKSMFTYH